MMSSAAVLAHTYDYRLVALSVCIAVLASYLSSADELDLGAYLGERVFANAGFDTVDPVPADVAGFAAYLDRYRAGLVAEAAAVEAL